MKTDESKNPYQDQILRCSSLSKFPLYPQGIRELRDTLKRAAKSPTRAERIMDKILNERDVCPTPKELAAIAEEIIREEESTPAGCEDCHGQPWVVVEKTIYDPLLGRNDIRSGARRCVCARGEWFRAKDRERKGSSA